MLPVAFLAFPVVATAISCGLLVLGMQHSDPLRIECIGSHYCVKHICLAAQSEGLETEVVQIVGPRGLTEMRTKQEGYIGRITPSVWHHLQRLLKQIASHRPEAAPMS